MTPRVVTLTMPLPPAILNTRTHWAKKQRERHAWEQRAIAGERALRGRHRPMRKAKLTAIFHVRQLHDVDNLCARLKFPLDLLVKRGLIVDDSPKHLTLTDIPEQRPRSKPQRVELRLEEVS